MPTASLTHLRTARRVLLHGVTGAGKSTAAHRLSQCLALPMHNFDEEIGWLPGWVNRDPADVARITEELTARPRWIIDSAYGSVRQLVYDRADVVVALDYSRALTLGRLVRRTWQRVRFRQQVCNGNVEKWRNVFSRDSVVLWHFQSYAPKRARTNAWANAASGTPVLVLRHPRQLDKLLQSLESPE